MASENDTVAEIGERMRKVDPTAFVVWWDQLAAAHKRELAAKDDERLTIVANYENVIADKDAKIAELRERIKIAEDALTELQTRLVASVHDGTMNPYEALDITERALAAVRGKGGAK